MSQSANTPFSMSPREQDKRRALAALDSGRAAPCAQPASPAPELDRPLSQIDALSNTAPAYAFSRALKAGLDALRAMPSQAAGMEMLTQTFGRILECQLSILKNGNLADELTAARATVEVLEQTCQNMESKLLDALAQIGNGRRDADEMENRLAAAERRLVDVVRQRDELAETLMRLRREHHDTLRALTAAEAENCRRAEESDHPAA